MEFNLNNDEIMGNDSKFIKKHGNIYISDEQVKILENYNFNVNNYKNISDLIYDIEQFLNNSSEFLEDLEWVSETLSEYNYYNNTNK